ncbi:MAG: type II toxin-antitoxin system RelE/ParE family toxin [Acidobacteria bacterium]|nr:type II toxin-antitoxin system RelE/ParE family toxin [Acidobacteriota bacterium]
MADYRVVLARSAEREFFQLPGDVQERVRRAIDKLGRNPRPPGVKKLHGANQLWRIRVGDYRCIYRIEDRERLVDVTHVRHRREAYE